MGFGELVAMMVDADLDRLRGVNDGPSSMRVLVTGADGFVGRHLVPRLVETGHEVTSRLPASARAAEPRRPALE